MRTLRSVWAGLARSPLKSTLTLLTVGLGVGVLIFTLSISGAFSRLIRDQLEKDGLVVMVGNLTRDDSTGELEPVRPSQFDENVLSVLRSDVPGIRAISPIGRGMFDEMAAAGTVYRLRTVVPAGEEYASLMHLELLAGSSFTAEDVATGARKALISRSLAEILYGSVEKALGASMQPPAPTADAGFTGIRNRGPVMPTFTVAGVFRDVPELTRNVYGVGDMVLPYTALFTRGMNSQMARREALTTVALRVQGLSLEAAETRIRQALTRQYGEDVKVEVWEGTANGGNTELAEARATVAVFSLVVNLLGFVLLVTGSIGILSIMLVEVLARTREIAVERALGASRSAIGREYLARSLVLSGLSALVGVVLALVFSRPLERLVLPIFQGVSAADLGGVVSPAAVAVGVGTALVVGGLFGVFPVIPTLRANIAEGMREG